MDDLFLTQKEGLNYRMSISYLQKSSAGGQLSTAEKTDPWYLQVRAGYQPFFCCSEDQSGIRHLDSLFRNTLSVRDFAVASGRQKDILPRPTEFLAKGKYA